MPRTETDSIGQRALPDNALYGVNTLRGFENFDISPLSFGREPELVRAMVQIKRAAAFANSEIGAIEAEKATAIVAACDKVLNGDHEDQFIINMLEGSGGTSINMNVNEVIANRALQISGEDVGQYDLIHPNDDVNAGQSTNDVLPSAVKLAVFEKCRVLVGELEHLAEVTDGKAKEFARVLKIGRTCMQAAQPMTLGQEFSGYASAISRCQTKVDATSQDLLVLPLGGTAIGTGLGAQAGYHEAVYRHLSDNLGYRVKPTSNLFDGMQNSDGFARISSEIRIAAEIIGKICLDLIILSSGTKSGIGEIKLPAVQPGSSIMPGKVNPVLPMMMQQVTYAVVGNDTAVSLASLGGQLEINHFEPIIASRLFDSLDLLTKGSRIFADKCVAGIVALEEQALENLLGSSALATAFVPVLGYSQVSKIVKEAEKDGRFFVDVAVEMGLLKNDDIIERLFEATSTDVESFKEC